MFTFLILRFPKAIALPFTGRQTRDQLAQEMKA